MLLGAGEQPLAGIRKRQVVLQFDHAREEIFVAPGEFPAIRQGLFERTDFLIVPTGVGIDKSEIAQGGEDLRRGFVLVVVELFVLADRSLVQVFSLLRVPTVRAVQSAVEQVGSRRVGRFFLVGHFPFVVLFTFNAFSTNV